MATYWMALDSWCSLVRPTRANRLGRGTATAGGLRKARWRAMFLISGCTATVLQLPLLCASVAVAEQEEIGARADAGDGKLDLSAAVGIAADSSIFSGSIGAGDSDETPEGRQRIQEIEKRASQLFRERERVQRERRPFALRRDSMLGEAAQARERTARDQSAAVATERQIAHLESQAKWFTGSLGKELRTKQSRLRASLNTLMRRIKSDQNLVDDRMAKMNALNLQIASLDERLLQLEEELSECRKQWLGIRQPLEKYSRGDFEGLRRVLDDWLVMDGQWPEAFAWAALCAYELDEISSASVYLEKAQRLRADLYHSKKRWPALEALTVLIRRRQLGQSYKADAALSRAIKLADKNSDWETYFLLGRYYSERPDEGVRAKTHFQRALTIQPNCDCAKLWLARLQTTSTLATVRDLTTGTAYLEQLWDKSGRRSWRLARFLAEAYSASQRIEDAEAMWSRAAELAPVEVQHQLDRHRKRSTD